jgi:predicted PurR-regulated permease PerM
LVLKLLCIAIFLSVALGPAVDNFRKLKLPRPAAILATFIAMFLAIFLIGLIVAPPIVNEVEAFADDVPNYIDDIRSNETLREYDDKYDITQKLEDQASSLPSRLGDAAGALQAVTVGVFSTILQLVTVLTITFFLLLDGGRIVNFILSQVRRSHQERVRKVAADIYGATGGYVAGALALATAAGISTYAMLSILGVPFAVPLAVLMAFFDLIPLVGSTIGGTLVALVTLFADFPGDTLIWVAFVVGYQQVENSVLQPMVYRRTVNLHPLAVITAILIGSSLLGVLGALVAIPIAAAIQIALRDVWLNRPSQVLGPDGEGVTTAADEQPPREVELPPGTTADAPG